MGARAQPAGPRVLGVFRSGEGALVLLGRHHCAQHDIQAEQVCPQMWSRFSSECEGLTVLKEGLDFALSFQEATQVVPDRTGLVSTSSSPRMGSPLERASACVRVGL